MASDTPNDAETSAALTIPLSRFRAELQKGGSQRLRELLSQRDPVAAVAEVDPLELFCLGQDVGEADAIEAVALATPEQTKRVIDIGLGRGAQPDMRALERWMHAVAARGPGQLTEFFNKLDEELQTLYLARRVRVFETREEDELPDPLPNAERYKTPDGTFILEVITGDASEVDETLPQAANDEQTGDAKAFSPLQLVADLYYVDWRRADEMMRDVRFTLAAELEETIARVREARLEEMGFPSADAAFKLYARRPSLKLSLSKREHQTVPRATMPLLYTEPFLADSLLVRALQDVRDPEVLGQLESELIYLVNAACVVEGHALADAEEIRALGRDVRNWVSLGLEIAAASGALDPVALVTQHPLRELFSLGLEQAYKVGDWAKKADASSLFRLPGVSRRMLSAEDEQLLRALLAPIPRVSDGLNTTRAFASRADVANTQKRLETMAAQALAVRVLLPTVRDFTPLLEGCEPDASAATSEMLLRSALVRKTLGASLQDSLGVTDADLRAFARKAYGDVWPAGILGAPPGETAAALQAVWTQLVADVRAAGEAPDARFLGLIAVRTG